jgi:ADP-heptose:LPS heptosyltransferase
MLRRNVLIFHNAALGDFLMTWPLAIALGRVAAQSRIIYVTAAQKGRLAERVIHVEFNDIENGWHALHGDAAELPETPTKLLKSAQMVFVFAQSPDDAFLANVRSVAGEIPITQIVPNPAPGAGVHVLQHQLAQLSRLAIVRQGVEQVQTHVRTNGLWSTPPKHPQRVVIHPGSGAARKNWPIEKFVEVATQLMSQGRDVVWLAGEVERERFDAATFAAMRQTGRVDEPADTLALFDAITDAGAYVGNDSGPTHLSAMLGRPTVALYGPTSDPAAWSPVGPRVKVLGFEASADEVVAAIPWLGGIPSKTESDDD